MLHGELELLVGGVEVGHEVEAVVIGLLGVGAGLVDLVHDDHDRKAGRDGVREHEAGLRHRALGGVAQQQRAVGHAQDALDLAAEVGVARGVDDVDLDALLVVGVEHALLYLLVRAEGVRGLQQLVHERGLAVVDVRDDGNVPDVLLAHMSLSMSRCLAIRQLS